MMENYQIINNRVIMVEFHQLAIKSPQFPTVIVKVRFNFKYRVLKELQILIMATQTLIFSIFTFHIPTHVWPAVLDVCPTPVFVPTISNTD